MNKEENEELTTKEKIQDFIIGTGQIRQIDVIMGDVEDSTHPIYDVEFSEVKKLFVLIEDNVKLNTQTAAGEFTMCFLFIEWFYKSDKPDESIKKIIFELNRRFEHKRKHNSSSYTKGDQYKEFKELEEKHGY